MSKFTPWFSDAVVPIRAGVYQRRGTCFSFQDFAKFDGGMWLVGQRTAKEAEAGTLPSLYLVGANNFQWRGLAKEQSNV